MYNEPAGYYEAPLQMKANGGMFLIDDFGRQQVRPLDLLNRWIVPLEKRVDYLTLITGQEDRDAVRRADHLLHQPRPDASWRTRRSCAASSSRSTSATRRAAVPRDLQAGRPARAASSSTRAASSTCSSTTIEPTDRPLRMCQPRDLLDQLIAIARYKMLDPDDDAGADRPRGQHLLRHDEPGLMDDEAPIARYDPRRLAAVAANGWRGDHDRGPRTRLAALARPGRRGRAAALADRGAGRRPGQDDRATSSSE